MKSYRIRIGILSVIVMALLVAAPFFRFYVSDFFAYWPYFDWEIGFGPVPFEAERPFIFIEEVDGVPIDPPVSLNDYFLKKKVEWNPTKDYLIQTTLLHAYNGVDSDLDSAKKLLGERYLIRISDKSVTYYLAKVTFDPIEYRKNFKPIREQILFREKYEH